MFQKITVLLEMIKFKLTIFAMPFAFMGAFLAERGVPDALTFLWVVLAMVGARTCAMGFNRIVDARFDSANPRTADRAIPSGAVSSVEAWIMVIAAGALFFFAAWSLNPLTLKLAPVALGLTLFYSLTKRFTSFCHLILGVALAFSPLGGWVAVQGSLISYPWALSLGVLFWIAGFDTIYACLDADFDKKAGLHSLPSQLGQTNAFRLAVLFHIIAFCLFAFAGVQAGLNLVYYIGVLIAAGVIFYQHKLVNPNDLSKIKGSFFSLNGIISMVLFAATWLSLIIEG
ncbi:4-hydroxybenzoate polyprenyltransferase [Desulfocapsa sulfexigens DSM 10523]|uniref:4-hydroxybenzoate polyprenyltransferase n=1 Tax=Desulfocapsa sulfexigens (strain DSM 10523 / SB164P1) TaxID=1167006 RepID=M1PI51_DESSD|nr:UbiA-like polyprenyltransferase [Desulfocapsa sulfexigens]AGF79275.1 4-hydroxybenzoate polyprenyltransferase [Desulfocapsa sulfexigens DSM 10523]